MEGCVGVCLEVWESVKGVNILRIWEKFVLLYFDR